MYIYIYSDGYFASRDQYASGLCNYSNQLLYANTVITRKVTVRSTKCDV